MSFRQGARQFFEKRGAPTPPLPYDYAVEYIETDGVASYIDTGITPVFYGNPTSSVEITFSVQRIGNSECMCGARYGGMSSGTFLIFTVDTSTTNRIQSIRPSLTSSSPISPIDNDIHTFSMKNGEVVVDGQIFSVAEFTTNPTTPFMLGCGGDPALHPFTSSNYKPSNSRFYSCKIYTGGVLVFNGIPVVANGLAGLYDSISGAVKTNAAESGTITAGPRV